MLSLLPLDRYTWEACAALETLPEDTQFMPSVLHSLAQAKFEPLTPLGIAQDGQMVGFAMYGVFGGICWISRILVAAPHREKGLAREAISLLVKQLQLRQECREIRASYHPENLAAAHLFASAGFVPINYAMEEEVVVKWTG